MYFKPVPEKPDALPDRMSNLAADAWEPVVASPLWTPGAAACFDPFKAPNLHLGKIPEVADCCPTQ